MSVQERSVGDGGQTSCISTYHHNLRIQILTYLNTVQVIITWTVFVVFLCINTEVSDTHLYIFAGDCHLVLNVSSNL